MRELMRAAVWKLWPSLDTQEGLEQRGQGDSLGR